MNIFKNREVKVICLVSLIINKWFLNLSYDYSK